MAGLGVVVSVCVVYCAMSLSTEICHVRYKSLVSSVFNTNPVTRADRHEYQSDLFTTPSIINNAPLTESSH